MTIMEPRLLPTVETRQRIAAAPDAVFNAWIVPDLVEAWWGPDGFTTKVHKLDAKQGGYFEFEMKAADGSGSFAAGYFREITRPTRLVMEFTKHCNTHLPEGVSPQLAPSFLTVTFTQCRSGTDVILKHAKLHAVYAELARFGWAEALVKLQEAAVE